MPFDLGSNVRLEAECRDPGGTLTTASTAVLTITLPDGTTATPAVPAPGETGRYRVDYVPAQAGRHAVRWLWAAPADAYTDSFDVRQAVPPMLVSLAETKRHLQLTRADRDDELRSWIETVTDNIEGLVGVCVRRTVTEVHSIQPSGVMELCLRRTPAIALTAVTGVLTGSNGYTVGELHLDGELGIVRRLDGNRLTGLLQFSYEAGRVIVQSGIRDAAKIILQHMWRTHYGASRAGAALGGGDDFAVTEPYAGWGYAVPNRAVQLLEPHRLPSEVG